MIYLGQDPVGVNSVHSLVIDDNAGNGDTGMTWSADKLTAEFGGKLDASEKGAANGVAGLDVNGKIPSSQLPSYVDDVVEYANLAGFPQTGESGKIYVALDTNKTYRWSGSSYVEISQSLALGETSTTAYRGDRGAAAYAAAVTNVENSPTEDSNNLITSGAVYEGLEAKMDFDPEYGREVAGVANKLLSDKYTEDNTPYLMRKAYDAEFDEETLVGGTVCWNQLAPSGFKNCRAQKNLYSAMLYNEDIVPLSISISNGHKYLITFIQPAGCSLYKQNVTGLNTPWKEFSAPSVNTRIHLFAEGTGNYTSQSIAAIVTKNETTEDYYAVSDVQVFNLTKMFGPVIADYIYDNRSYETNIGYNWFIEKFPKAYYSYDAGSLQSVQAAAHKMVGFNAWDEQWETGVYNFQTGEKGNSSVNIRSKNFIPVIPNATYYIKCDYTVIVLGYDANKNFVKYLRYNSGNSTFVTRRDDTDCYFITFCTVDTPVYGGTYKNDICINLSDPNRNGEYEPYKSTSYPFDDSLTLRGLPKLDSSNNLYYDGDTYNADGTVTRRWGYVDMGDLTWQYETQNTEAFFYTRTLSTAETNPMIKTVTGFSDDYIRCAKYQMAHIASNMLDPDFGSSLVADKSIAYHCTSPSGYMYIYIKDSAYTDADVFKTTLSGVYLVYELATPTTESAAPYTLLQNVDRYGTEEFTEWGTRDVEIPVGHSSKYYKDKRRETVTDVQINGTSITTNGVANVPTASFTEYGVAKLYQYGGLQIDSSTGGIKTNPASSSIIKTGTNTGYPIVPNYQHESVFYGLAKAAGDTTQASSSNAVGTFTPEALRAIRVMLGLPKYVDWELISDITVSEDSTEIKVEADLNGQPFELRKLIAIFNAGLPTTATRDAFYGQVFIERTDGVRGNDSFPSLQYPAATSEMLSRIEIEIRPNAPMMQTVCTATSDGNTQNLVSMVKQRITDKFIYAFRIYQSGSNKSLIPSGANLKIYGIRY